MRLSLIKKFYRLNTIMSRMTESFRLQIHSICILLIIKGQIKTYCYCKISISFKSISIEPPEFLSIYRIIHDDKINKSCISIPENI